ncbi:hypothetical protein RJ55_02297 [Drechmeria coniospora]|nr:hypothetical protein RJ55_02297 [Drechmeria coniospora]
MGAMRVAVIGGGPAGCMLARLLHAGGIDVTVFEGDAAPDFRGQGGTLDLHTKTGLAALREAGLFDEFEKHARYDGQYIAIVDKDLKYHFVRNADDRTLGERPEIDRARLRELLIKSLPEGMIHWGHRLRSVDDKTLVFQTTKVSGFDLVVGADGAWSKVRQAIAPDLKPEYVGVAMTELSIPDAKETAPEMYKIVNRGSVFVSNDGQRVSFQQMGDDSINIYTSCVRDDVEWMKAEKCGYDTDSLEQTKKHFDEVEFKDWCPQLKDALGRTQGRCIPRSLHMLPIGARWKHKPGFTMIGDAAHLMTPHAAEGVNQALEDAMHLARTIIDADKNGKDLDDEVARFEEEMRARVEPVQQLAYDLCQYWLFTPGAPRSVMPIVVSRHVKPMLPFILQPFFVAGVYAYYFLKNLWG